MARDKDKIPDELSPKDIALLLLINAIQQAEVAAMQVPEDKIEELAHNLGWVQYTCTPRKLAMIREQITKAAERMRPIVVEPLKKRHILE